MIKEKSIYSFLFITLALVACKQEDSNRTFLGKEYAVQELKSTLDNNSQHNVIDNRTIIIKDSITAVHIAESILFSVYGKDHITKQRPYEVYLIDNYWSISGTLPVEEKGGTFLIIIDSRDCKVIKLIHYK